MPQFLLVGTRACPWVQRAAIVLREKAVPFEMRYIYRASDREKYPDWVLALSPLGKVPILRVDDRACLFESSAITEYLDETLAPRLHPADHIQRATNRAWIENVSKFAAAANGAAYVNSQSEFDAWLDTVAPAFALMERALSESGSGPYFNGDDFSLVDAAYAPFLQRYRFLDRIMPIGKIEAFPRLHAWADALRARPSIVGEPEAEFEAAYLDVLTTWNAWLAPAIRRARRQSPDHP